MRVTCSHILEAAILFSLGAVLFNNLSNTVKTSQIHKEFNDKCKTYFNHFITLWSILTN